MKFQQSIIRSVKLQRILALTDLGLKMLQMLNIFEVKRNDSKSRPPNKQAVDKAENQLTNDVQFLKSLQL